MKKNKIRNDIFLLEIETAIRLNREYNIHQESNVQFVVPIFSDNFFETIDGCDDLTPLCPPP